MIVNRKFHSMEIQTRSSISWIYFEIQMIWMCHSLVRTSQLDFSYWNEYESVQLKISARSPIDCSNSMNEMVAKKSAGAIK